MTTGHLTLYRKSVKLYLLPYLRSAPLFLALAWFWLLPSKSYGELPLNPPQVATIYLESFLGIDFGSSLEDAENLYPTGLEETSPLGYPCYHVTGLATRGIEYHDVIYQFDDNGRMRVVFAKFPPSSDEAVLEQLRTTLGEPLKHSINGDTRIVEALWPTADGGIVHYNRQWHLFVVINTFDSHLTQDVDLRLANYFE
jgi:hypothetical protein